MSKKTYNDKEDFIEILSRMTDVEINDYIISKGKPPKKMLFCRVVNKEDNNDR